MKTIALCAAVLLATPLVASAKWAQDDYGFLVSPRSVAAYSSPAEIRRPAVRSRSVVRSQPAVVRSAPVQQSTPARVSVGRFLLFR